MENLSVEISIEEEKEEKNNDSEIEVAGLPGITEEKMVILFSEGLINSYSHFLKSVPRFVETPTFLNKVLNRVKLILER